MAGMYQPAFIQYACMPGCIAAHPPEHGAGKPMNITLASGAVFMGRQEGGGMM